MVKHTQCSHARLLRSGIASYDGCQLYCSDIIQLHYKKKVEVTMT